MMVAGLTGLLFAGVSASPAESRAPVSDSAPPSAQDVMAKALRDLDLSVETYQGEGRSMPRATGPNGSPPRNQANEVPPLESPAMQAEWDDLLLTPDPRVQAWQEYFSGPAGARLVAAFDRLTPFRERVGEILNRVGLPQDLIAVAFVESELSNHAVSSKGATGAWQFMPATAARYGLEQGARFDERTDLEKSTVAAAHYLADLHRLLGDWALALSAYNVGEDGVLKAIAKGKTRSFWKLSQQGLLPDETMEYVPKVLGAARAWKSLLPAPAAAGQPGEAPVASTDRRQGWVYAVSSSGLDLHSLPAPSTTRRPAGVLQ